MLNLQSAPRKAGPLRVALVGLATVLITLGYSVRVLLLGAIGRLRRAKVDGFTRDWSASLLSLTGARLSRHGEVPDFGDGRRYMILCTHSSFYDIPAIFVTMPGSIRMLAKRELFAVPVWGAAMRAAEFPSIDRHNRHQAVADLARARAMMESGIVLWLRRRARVPRMASCSHSRKAASAWRSRLTRSLFRWRFAAFSNCSRLAA